MVSASKKFLWCVKTPCLYGLQANIPLISTFLRRLQLLFVVTEDLQTILAEERLTEQVQFIHKRPVRYDGETLLRYTLRLREHVETIDYASHADLVRGEPVRAAGTLTIAEKGALKEVFLGSIDYAIGSEDFAATETVLSVMKNSLREFGLHDIDSIEIQKSEHWSAFEFYRPFRRVPTSPVFYDLMNGKRKSCITGAWIKNELLTPSSINFVTLHDIRNTEENMVLNFVVTKDSQTILAHKKLAQPLTVEQPPQYEGESSRAYEKRKGWVEKGWVETIDDVSHADIAQGKPVRSAGTLTIFKESGAKKGGVLREVFIASDTDASVIADNAAKFAIDCLAEIYEYEYPVYLIGLGKWWVFKSPLHVIPIDCSHLAVTIVEQSAELDDDGKKFLIDLIQKVPVNEGHPA